MEPKYVDDPFEDGPIFGKVRPKWQTPDTDFERRVLTVFGMKFYPDKVVGGKEMAGRLRVIGKSLVSLESGLVPSYPTEWVNDVLAWYRKKRLVGAKALHGFLNSLEDGEWRSRFVSEWQAKRATADYGKQDDDTIDDFRKYLR